MLFHSSLRKELARSFGATLVVLVTIVMTMTLIRTLSQASRGSVNPQEVMMVMGYTVMSYLPPVLTLSLFIAIVSTLSRVYSDSEMVIWFTAGRGLTALLKPLLAFAWPILLVVTVMALVGWPWANRQTIELKHRYGNRGDLERVAPGQFQESASGTRVFFLDKDTPDNKSGKNVFIASVENGRETVTSARGGRVVTEGSNDFLLLSNGQRVQRALNGGELKVTDFVELGNQVGTTQLASSADIPARTLSTRALVSNPTPVNQGELAWRVGLALATFNFVVIAITVSSVNPRATRTGNLLFALFAFVIYYNLLNLGQSWIASGRASFAGFMVGLHGGVFACALLWLLKQHHNWRLIPRWRRTPRSA
jgi:lipopolysaccharide export system permease protein